MKPPCGAPAGQGAPSAEASGVSSVQAGDQGALRAADLQAHVVAGAVVAGGGAGGEGAVVQGEQRDAGVDVVGGGEEVLAAVGAGGVHLGDLAAGDPPDDVEVVHGAVAEDAAGGREVAGVRRRRVAGAGPQGVGPAEPAGGDRLAQRPVPGVEAALEPDVQRDGRVRPSSAASTASVSASVPATGFSQKVGSPAAPGGQDQRRRGRRWARRSPRRPGPRRTARPGRRRTPPRPVAPWRGPSVRRRRAPRCRSPRAGRRASRRGTRRCGPCR